MRTPLDEYKAFIDALVSLRPSVLARWVREKGWPQLPENEKFNRLRAELTPEQLEVVAEIAQAGRDEGIHDVLAYLVDEINLRGLRLSRNGVEFAIEPYGTEMHYDWVARLAGTPWPDATDLKEIYKSQQADKPDTAR